MPYGGNILTFLRLNIWNPYKRMVMLVDASEEDIWSARNFSLDQLICCHERSVESIEAAFEKLLMTSFLSRKKTKINLKTQLKKKVEESPPWVKKLLGLVEVPPSVISLRRSHYVWPPACTFSMTRPKALPRAAIFGFGALLVGWISGSLLNPLVPSSLLQPTWTLELLKSLAAYIFLFIACMFLK